MKKSAKKTFANKGRVVTKNMKEKIMDLRVALGVSNLGIFQTTVAVPQGTGIFQRTGDLIRLTRIHCNRFYVYGDNVGNVVRLVVFQTAGGFTPTVLSDIFSWGATGSEDVTSEFLPNLLGRRVFLLLDELVSLNPGGSNAILVKRDWLSPQIREIEFEQGTSNIVDGQIFIVALADSAVIPHPALNIAIRTYFTDA